MSRNRVLLILILFIAFFFRFYNSPNRYGIGYDGSRDALVAFESAKQIQLPLTGSFSSIGPITFGPLYYWYITLATLLPTIWGPWVAIDIASFLMVLVMYKTGKLLISEQFGIILAFVTALSPAQIISGTQLQQHALIGFLSSVVIYFFVKHYYQKFRTFEYILWGFCLGAAINSHYQAVSLLTLPLLAIIFFKRKIFIFVFVLGLFISFIPFLIFELTNHWFNTRNILDYILIGQYRVWISNRWLLFLGNFIPRFWSYVTGIPIFLSSTIFFSSFPIILYLYIKKVLSKPFFLILLSFLTLLISLRYYRGEKFFGYLQFFHPYIFIFTSLILYLLVRKFRISVLPTFIIIYYITLVVPSSFSSLSSDSFNQITKRRVELLSSHYPNQVFTTYECKGAYNAKNDIQGLTLMLFMNKKFSNNGRKVALYNKECDFFGAKRLDLNLIDLSGSSASGRLAEGELYPMTPYTVWDETVRWYFREKP